MPNMLRSVLCVLLTLTLTLALAGPALANDWPNWRGPEGTGIAPAPKFDPTLAGGSPKVLWAKDIGNGYSAVTVADGKAYAAGYADGKETLFSFDAADGEDVWSKSYPAKNYDSMNAGGPSSTPAVAAGKVVHVSRDGVMRCFDARTGEPHWDLALIREFGSKMGRWGFAGSPVIDGDTVLIDAGRVARIGLADGKVLWKTDDYTAKDGGTYSTPVPFSLKGRDFVAAFPEQGLVILDAKTGKLLAKHGWITSYGVNAATPIVHDDLIFISSGYNTGAALLRLTDAGLKVVWEGRQMRNQMPTCLLIDGHLYGFDDKVLKCLGLMTGEEKWAQRGLGQGTLIGTADGHLIVMTDKGELITAKATPDGFTPIATVEVIDESNVWTTPTLADGRLYCRGSRGSLVCLDATGAKQ